MQTLPAAKAPHTLTPNATPSPTPPGAFSSLSQSRVPSNPDGPERETTRYASQPVVQARSTESVTATPAHAAQPATASGAAGGEETGCGLSAISVRLNVVVALGRSVVVVVVDFFIRDDYSPWTALDLVRV